MKFKLRDYQAAAVQSIYDYYESGKKGNPVLALPVGSGKSLIIAAFLESVYRQYNNQRTLILTHVKEILSQDLDKLLNLWPEAPAGVYSAGIGKRQLGFPITFAGIGSVFRRAKELDHIDLIIVDEAHLVSPTQTTMYCKLLADLTEINPKLKVIGLTATPWRKGQGSITAGGIFTDMCFDLTRLGSFNKLIAEGYLSSLIPKQTKQELDVSNVKITGGDYNQAQLQIAVDKDEITYAALQETLELAGDRKHWLIFCAGVDHAQHVVETLCSLGIECLAVLGETVKEERDKTLDRFKSGDLRAIAVNNIATVGFDSPNIDLIVMLRPTQSVVLWVQAIGRGARPVYAPGFDLETIEGRLAAIAAGPKCNCLVLDFSGNTRRLGPINDPLLPNKRGAKRNKAPVKLCLNCKTYNHTTAQKCIDCGQIFEFKTDLQTTAGTAEVLRQSEMPVVEVIQVQHVTYAAHLKAGRPPSLCVTYFCGLQRFREFVCFEHMSVRWRAVEWWKEHSQESCPLTVAEAMEVMPRLPAPTHIRVHINKVYPEILARCYDGSAFNTLTCSMEAT